jgi:mono/diheme cytochrome c family protein
MSFLLAGCTATVPPPVTPEMARTSGAKPTTVTQLQHGRILFASRCIECHTLPPVTAHNDTEWPHLVNAMAGRASLKPAEKEAVLAYILAARAQQ